jgi:2-dehydro-3-deoxygluconokinase
MEGGPSLDTGGGPPSLDIVAFGEPLVEFTAEERGPLEAVRTFRRGWGGDTSNAAVAAARLGVSVGYVTRLGSDEFGRSFLTLWQGEGVDTSRVVVDPEGYTGVYFIAFEEDGAHDFTYYRQRSAASRLRAGELDPNYLASCRILHTSGITQAISDSSRAATQEALTAARARNVTISYDANIRPKLAPLAVLRQTFESTVTLADIVFVSDEDVRHLYGEVPLARAVGAILGRGPQLVVVKTGVQGCIVASADGRRDIVSAFPVRPVDTTGAGDAFDAGFLVRWLEGGPPNEAAAFANAVAALTTSGLGAVGPLPTRSRVERFLEAGRPTVTQVGPAGDED